MAGWSGTEDELDGYVVSVVASHDAPAKSRSIARRQDGEFFSARPATWRDEVRAQELAVTSDDVRALAPSMRQLAADHAVVVFGPRQKAAEAGLDFEVVDLMDPQPADASTVPAQE